MKTVSRSSFARVSRRTALSLSAQAIASPAIAKGHTPVRSAGNPIAPAGNAHAPRASYGRQEHLVDLGEVRMNYVAAGQADAPALLLIPGQTEAWWGYSRAIDILEKDFRLYVVDLRGQGLASSSPILGSLRCAATHLTHVCRGARPSRTGKYRAALLGN